MMRSLFSGVSGLRNHQTRMDVIGNNIANVNTVGFKGGRVQFQDVLSQTMQGASSPTGAGRGGTNPMQVGLGMGLASIDTIFTDGSFQPTGKNTDLSIQGQGFFVLSPNGDPANTVYTRAGNFDFDEQGNYLVPGTGYKVMGYMAVNGVVGNTLGPLRVPVGTSMAPQATTTATLEKNLGGNSAALNSTITKTLTVYDPSGNPNTVTCTLEKLTANTWQVTASGTGVVPTPANVTLTFDANGTIAAPIPAYEIEVTGPTGAVANVTFDFTGLTNYTGDATIAADTDGYKMGTLQSTTIDSNGNLVGRFDNGQSQILGQVALATCDNPAGLTKVGSNLFMESNNSGKVTADKPGTGGRGTLNPGTLEMANVDLANEFSNMIITQRGFQANSKIITVTDEMLQELANLKR